MAYAARTLRLQRNHPVRVASQPDKDELAPDDSDLPLLGHNMSVKTRLGCIMRELKPLVAGMWRRERRRQEWDSPWQPPLTDRISIVVDPGPKEDAAVRHAQFLSRLPNDAVTVYTDGSKEGSRCSLAACVVDTKTGEIKTKVSHRLQDVEVADCESAAIVEALTLLAKTEKITKQARPCYVFVDSQAAIARLRKHGHFAWQARRVLGTFTSPVTVMWCPGHMGIVGNEIADAVARQALESDDERKFSSLGSVFARVRRFTMDKWETLWAFERDTAAGPSHGSHYLRTIGGDPVLRAKAPKVSGPRWLTSAYFQMKVGKGNLLPYLLLIKKTDSDRCRRCQEHESESVEHVLLHCAAFSAERQEMAMALSPKSLDLPTLFNTNNGTEVLLKFVRKTGFCTKAWVEAFHNIRIEPGHEWKTAFRTRLGSFEWNVMPFGLSNAPAQFQRFLNSVLQEYLDLFCSAYVDDILVYTDGSLDEHKEQVNHVLAKLVKAGLTVDIDKCEFGVQEVKYLGYIIKPGKATMDPAKVQAVKDWPVPSSKKELRGFLGFANFYRPFIKNFAEVAVPLTSLTGHLVPFVWSPECQAAFSSLKDLFCASPVLRLFDHSLPTTVEADSSGYSTGAVLLQQHPDGLFPCAYISQKLSPAESNYEIHDKEMLAIVRALKEWRGELRGAQGPIRVLTDHKNLLHFTSAQQLTERQARWANLLSEFDLTLEHRPGKLSPLPDALSRLHMPSGPDDPRLQARNQQLLQCLPDGALKVRSARVTLPSPFRKEALSTLWEQALSADSDYAAACAVVASQAPKWPDSLKTNWRVSLSECSLDSEGRLRYRSRLWVPQWEPLRTALLQEIHDSVTLVHPGQRIMCQEVSKTYFWPHYTADVKRFCRNCEICGSTNVMRQLKQGLLKPLPVPDRIWRDIGIDLIGPLPPCKKEGKVYKHVMTVVDHLSKGVILIACRSLDIEYLASRFLEVYYPRHGLPNSIASDRQFANMFWKRLCTTLKIDRRLSTAYHPQTNGATERTNAEVKTKMAKLLHDRSDWLDCLPIVEFALNAAPAASTETSPFTLSHGYIKVDCS
ncbi:uncharacterized protein BROUX77_005528 [Berkeleyomyces rouxiae]|uniref:uncharacterized protein n=1 Tax=Berkeleyomyces rouxiae TaxID=2035830 RepID=UPI003B7F035B